MFDKPRKTTIIEVPVAKILELVSKEFTLNPDHPEYQYWFVSTVDDPERSVEVKSLKISLVKEL